MKKKLLLTILILVMASGSVFAGKIGFHLGAGYNVLVSGDSSASPQKYPLGFALYGGVGYRFIPTLSAGLEYEFAKTWALEETSGLNDNVCVMENIPKLYIKFNAMNMLTVTGMAGMDFQRFSQNGSKLDTDKAFTMGARVSLFFAYAQYMIIFNEDQPINRFTVGAAFSK